MGFVEWAQKMRKKSLEERRRFVAVCAITTVAVITLAWFIFFFGGVSEGLKSTGNVEKENAVER